MNNVFVGFSRIILLGISIFKGFTAQYLNKSFGVKGLICTSGLDIFSIVSVYTLFILETR
jgi:hypothetical protein